LASHCTSRGVGDSPLSCTAAAGKVIEAAS
jgi:hypothetical protein